MILKINSIYSVQQLVAELIQNDYIVKAKRVPEDWPRSGTKYFEITIQEKGE